MTAPTFQHPTFTYKATVQKVIDGDTIDVHIDVGFNTFLFKRLRFLGVDTWELELDQYEQGVEAKQRLVDLLEQSGYNVFVQTKMDTKGKYGRVLAWVWLMNTDGSPGRNINDTLLEEGHGVPL